MPRLSSTPLPDIHAAIDRAAKRITDAAGADRKTTAAELKKSMGALQGPEKTFANAFFSYLENRNGPREGVTKADLAAGVRFARKSMVDAYDADASGGITTKEQKGMSRTGQRAVDAARALSGESTTGAGQVAKLLGALSKDVVFSYFGSESDSPFKPFSAQGHGGAVTLAETRAALKLPAGEKYLEKSAAEFFTAMQDPEQCSDADRPKFAALQRAFAENLTDVKVFCRDEGVVEGKVYFVGRTRDGGLAGLEAQRIWT